MNPKERALSPDEIRERISTIGLATKREAQLIFSVLPKDEIPYKLLLALFPERESTRAEIERIYTDQIGGAEHFETMIEIVNRILNPNDINITLTEDDKCRVESVWAKKHLTSENHEANELALTASQKTRSEQTRKLLELLLNQDKGVPQEELEEALAMDKNKLQNFISNTNRGTLRKTNCQIFPRNGIIILGPRKPKKKNQPKARNSQSLPPSNLSPAVGEISIILGTLEEQTKMATSGIRKSLARVIEENDRLHQRAQENQKRLEILTSILTPPLPQHRTLDPIQTRNDISNTIRIIANQILQPPVTTDSLVKLAKHITTLPITNQPTIISAMQNYLELIIRAIQVAPNNENIDARIVSQLANPSF